MRVHSSFSRIARLIYLNSCFSTISDFFSVAQFKFRAKKLFFSLKIYLNEIVSCDLFLFRKIKSDPSKVQKKLNSKIFMV